MAEVRGETSNQNQATEEVAGQQFGRPIGAKHEVRQREIIQIARRAHAMRKIWINKNEMVDVRGETSNALFDTLEEWNDYLNKENIDPLKLSPNKPHLQNRGPRP